MNNMDYYNKYLNEIESHVSELSFTEGLMLSILCVRRNIPNYAYFTDRHKWGDISVVESCYNIAVNILKQDLHPYNSIDFKEVHRNLESVIPDMDDFGDKIEASFALNTCLIIESMLKYIHSRTKESLRAVFMYSMETVWMYIVDSEKLDVNNKKELCNIEKHKYAIEERNIFLMQFGSVKITKNDPASVDTITKYYYVDRSIIGY